MALRVRRVRSQPEFGAAIGAIGHYFGGSSSSDDAEQFARIMPSERVHAAFDGDAVVAGAGVYPVELSIPGGRLPLRRSAWSECFRRTAAVGSSTG